MQVNFLPFYFLGKVLVGNCGEIVLELGNGVCVANYALEILLWYLSIFSGQCLYVFF